MINEFGEEISEDTIEVLSVIISELPPELIDELWYRCGFIYAEKDLKALKKEDVEKMKKDRSYTKMMLEALLLETPLEDFFRALIKVLKSCRG